MSNQLLTEEYFGIPLPKDSPNVDRVNQGLNTILQNGTYAAIYRKWFAAAPPALPETAPGIVTERSRASWLEVITNSLPTLLTGVLITLQLALISVVVGLVFGSLIGIARLSEVTPLRWFARLYIDSIGIGQTEASQSLDLDGS